MNMQPQRAPVQPLLCWRKGVFHISTDRQLLDIEAIQRFLSLPDRAAAERWCTTACALACTASATCSVSPAW